jgi:trehalose 6-phosphate phosphatase
VRALRRYADLAPFFERLRAAGHGVLLLDYDGTLAPFTVDRDRAVPYPSATAAIAQIIAQGRTRVVIVSGRAVADVARLLRLSPLPEIWGSHGWERLGAEGAYRLHTLDPVSADRLKDARLVLDRLGLAPRREDKPVSVAAHWRGLAPAEADAICDRVMAAWAPLTTGSGLEIHAFDGGLELRARGNDKGSAVETVLAEEGPGVVAAYFGDDVTDEDAFRAIAGKGLGVLVRPEWRETLADLWLKAPQELLQFLLDWRDAIGGVSASS